MQEVVVRVPLVLLVREATVRGQRVVLVRVSRANPLHAVTQVPAILAEADVERAGPLGVLELANQFEDRVGRERTAVAADELRCLGTEAELTAEQFTGVAQGEVDAFSLCVRDVHVALDDRQATRARTGIGFTRDEAAVAGRTQDVVVALRQHGGCRELRNAVVDLHAEVVDCERQVAERFAEARFEHTTKGQRLRGFCLETCCRTTQADNLNAAVLRERAATRQTFGQATLADQLRGAVVEVVARVGVLAEEARGRALELLIQRRSAIRGAVAAAQREAADRREDAADLVGPLTAVRAIVGVAARGVERQVVNQLIRQDRQFDFAITFPHAIAADRGGRRGEAVQVVANAFRRRLIVDARFAVLDAQCDLDHATRQLEQRAVDVERDGAFTILGATGHRIGDEVEPCRSDRARVAADNARSQRRSRNAAADGVGARRTRRVHLHRLREAVGEDQVGGVGRVRPALADEEVVAPVERQLTAHTTIEADKVLRLVVVVGAIAGEDADARGVRNLRLRREERGAEAQFGRDQRAAQLIVQRQLAMAGLRRLATADQHVGVEFGVAEDRRLVGRFTVTGDDLRRRHDIDVEHVGVERVANVEIDATAADALIAGDRAADTGARTPAVADACIACGSARTDRGARNGDDARRTDRVDGDAAIIDVKALRTTRQRIDIVAGAEVIAIGAEIGGRALGPFDVAQLERFAAIIFHRCRRTEIVRAEAADERVAIAVARAAADDVVLCFGGDAVDVLARHDVDNARNRVRTIDRRSAGVQDFDAVDHRVRQHVEVGRADATTRTGRSDAAAVHQHQRTGRAQAAERHGVDARTTVDDEAAIGVVDLVRTTGDGGRLQDFSGRVETGCGRLVAGDQVDRVGTVELVATNARTDDGNFLCFTRRSLSGFVALRGILRIGDLRNGKTRARKRGRRQKTTNVHMIPLRPG